MQADLNNITDSPESSVRFLALLAGPFYPILHLVNERCGSLLQLAIMYQFGLWYMMCCLPSYIALALLCICVCTFLPVCGQWYLKYVINLHFYRDPTKSLLSSADSDALRTSPAATPTISSNFEACDFFFFPLMCVCFLCFCNVLQYCGR